MMLLLTRRYTKSLRFVSISSFESLLQIVSAASYLEIKTLHDVCTNEIAERMKNKSNKKFHNIFTREKEEAVALERDDTDTDSYSILRIIARVMFPYVLFLLYFHFFVRT
ncbi:hypothetical protein HAX54_007495 [Datura stramonium]|uniref:BTB domain-containing protein n=1 Tax=Datura stramonium TaxID=4076 RepID=A0ABS8TED0_DATST|nr:hypothetical protein [Datura stramonium]